MSQPCVQALGILGPKGVLSLRAAACRSSREGVGSGDGRMESGDTGLQLAALLWAELHPPCWCQPSHCRGHLWV